MHKDDRPIFRIRLDIEYDGTDYHGWQIQPAVRTVQGELQRAFLRLFDVSVAVYGSGRTDTGVHALNQVAHCDIPLISDAGRLRRSLNAVLPADIRIRDITFTSRLWDARRSAIARIYRYRIRRRPTALHRLHTWVHSTIPPVSELRTCSSLLAGRRDVHNFCRSNHERETPETYFFGAQWHISGEEIHFFVCATHFFHRLVRRLVGAQVALPAGRDPVAEFKSMLHGPGNGAPAAPSRGLSLIGPLYESDTMPSELQTSWLSVMCRRYPAAFENP